MEVLKKVLNYWKESAYLHPFVVLSCVYVYFKLRPVKNEYSKIFKLYVSAVATLFLIGDFCFSFSIVELSVARKVVEVANNLFTVAETIIFTGFFLLVLEGKSIKVFFKSGSMLYSSCRLYDRCYRNFH